MRFAIAGQIIEQHRSAERSLEYANSSTDIRTEK